MFVQNKGDWGNIFSFYWNEVKNVVIFWFVFFGWVIFLFYFLVFYGILFEKEGEGAKD